MEVDLVGISDDGDDDNDDEDPEEMKRLEEERARLLQELAQASGRSKKKSSSSKRSRGKDEVVRSDEGGTAESSQHHSPPPTPALDQEHVSQHSPIASPPPKAPRIEDEVVAKIDLDVVKEEAQSSTQNTIVEEEDDGENEEDDVGIDVDDMLEAPIEASAVPDGAIVKIRRKQDRTGELVEPLPPGWTEIQHSSGLIIYRHGDSRVATFGRPFLITSHNQVARSAPPVSAIPCLHKLRLAESIGRRAKELVSSSAMPMEEAERLARREAALPILQATTSHVAVIPAVTPDELYEYCRQRFHIRTNRSVHFAKWPELRQHRKQKKAERERQIVKALVQNAQKNDEEPSVTASQTAAHQLISAPQLDSLRPADKKTHPIAINTHGKTAQQILHEYVQKMYNTKIEWKVFENGSSSDPFTMHAMLPSRTVGTSIAVGADTEMSENGLPLFIIGRGTGASKKIAKLKAAQDALEKFFKVGYKFDESGHVERDVFAEENSLRLMDALDITAPTVAKLCRTVGEPEPFAILQDYVNERSLQGDSADSLKFERDPVRIGHEKHQFRLTWADKEVQVQCKNRKEAQELAAQKMLALLHPHMKTWGDVHRHYGLSMQQRRRTEQRREKKAIVSLQTAVQPPFVEGETSGGPGAALPPSTTAEDEAAGRTSRAPAPKIGPNQLIISRLRSSLIALDESFKTQTPDGTPATEQARLEITASYPEFNGVSEPSTPGCKLTIAASTGSTPSDTGSRQDFYPITPGRNVHTTSSNVTPRV